MPVEHNSKMMEGNSLLQQMVITDYENVGIGSETILAVGAMGTGKTTLGLKIIQRMTYLESKRISKNDYIEAYNDRVQYEEELIKRHYSKEEILAKLPQLPCKEIPKTILYSGREFDYWHVFLSSPSWHVPPKPVRLHLPAGNDFKFIVPFGEKGIPRELLVDDIVCQYHTTEELVNNLLEGGINVWYPPLTYKTPDSILHDMDLSKFTGKSKSPKYQMKPIYMNFELIYALMKYRYDKHCGYYIDEMHNLLPLRPSGIHWHLVEWYCNNVSTELRRCHISLYGTCHGVDMVEPRVVGRTHWLLWTGGAFPNTRFSRVRPNAVQQCRAGLAIIEKKKDKFGLYGYSRIPYQPPKMRVIQE